jgi:hypothetical protein
MKNRDAIGNPVLNKMATDTLKDFIDGLNFRRTDKMLRNFLIAYIRYNNGDDDGWFVESMEDLDWIYDLLDTLEDQYYEYDLDGKDAKEKDKKITELDKEIKKHIELNKDLLKQVKDASARDKKYLDLQVEFAQLQVKYSALLADIQMQKANDHGKTVEDHLKQVDQTMQDLPISPKRS